MKKNKYEKIIDEATVDCYGEYEQFSGWTCFLEEKLPLPLKYVIFGEEADIIGIDTDENGTCVLAIIKKGKEKIRVPVQDLKFKGKNAKYMLWIDAYKQWLG